MYVISQSKNDIYISKLKNKKSNTMTNKQRITKNIKQNKKHTTK